MENTLQPAEPTEKPDVLDDLETLVRRRIGEGVENGLIRSECMTYAQANHAPIPAGLVKHMITYLIQKVRKERT